MKVATPDTQMRELLLLYVVECDVVHQYQHVPLSPRRHQRELLGLESVHELRVPPVELEGTEPLFVQELVQLWVTVLAAHEAYHQIELVFFR